MWWARLLEKRIVNEIKQLVNQETPWQPCLKGVTITSTCGSVSLLKSSQPDTKIHTVPWVLGVAQSSVVNVHNSPARFQQY